MQHRLPIVRRLTRVLSLPEVLPPHSDPTERGARNARVWRSPSQQRARLEAEMRRHWWA